MSKELDDLKEQVNRLHKAVTSHHHRTSEIEKKFDTLLSTLTSQPSAVAVQSQPKGLLGEMGLDLNMIKELISLKTQSEIGKGMAYGVMGMMGIPITSTSHDNPVYRGM